VTRYDLQVYRHGYGLGCEDDWILMVSLPFSPSLLERLSAIGAIEIKGGMLTSEDAEKVGRILRLRRSLGVNLSGAAIITELMDRLEEKEQENVHKRSEAHE
jgi:MerR family transcriptional regulator, heat shock protein HspR